MIIQNNINYIYHIIFIVGLILSNIFSIKLTTLGPFIVTSGVICFSLTYLMTDVIGEKYGKQEAQKLVYQGFFAQLLVILLSQIALLLPTTDNDAQNILIAVFQQNIWFTLGSLIAYPISEFLDIFLFHKIKEKLQNNNKYKWIWNNIATITSQLIDTSIFLIVAFGLGQKFLFAIDTTILLFKMIGCQWFIKIILALCDTPFFYLLTINTNNRTTF